MEYTDKGLMDALVNAQAGDGRETIIRNLRAERDRLREELGRVPWERLNVLDSLEDELKRLREELADERMRSSRADESLRTLGLLVRAEEKARAAAEEESREALRQRDRALARAEEAEAMLRRWVAEHEINRDGSEHAPEMCEVFVKDRMCGDDCDLAIETRALLAGAAPPAPEGGSRSEA